MPAAPERAVLSYYFPQPALVRQITALGNAGGWSGSLIWRVSPVGNALRGIPAPRTDVPLADLCLRRWPTKHPSPDRLRFIHATLNRAAAAGLDFLPTPRLTMRGESFVEHAGHLWELAPWLAGVAEYHDHPTQPRLKAAFQAVARFHLATRDSPQTGPALAIVERLDRVSELRGQRLALLSVAVGSGLNATLDLRARRLLELAPPRLAALQAPLELAARQPLPLQPAIRDIHHDHVLFTGDEVTGLIDFGAMRIDTPLTDVARLLGSLVGDDPPSRQFALDAYADLRPLSSADRELIDLLDQATLVIGGLNWLVWLYLERRDMGELAPIEKRLDEILGRMETSDRGR